MNITVTLIGHQMEHFMIILSILDNIFLAHLPCAQHLSDPRLSGGIDL